MGGGRKRPVASIWDVDGVERALDREGHRRRFGRIVQNFLLRHGGVRRWEDVPWESSRHLREVPLAVRSLLRAEFAVRTSAVASKSTSKDGTVKLAMRLSDDAVVETVVIRHRTLRSNRVTVCVSSQIGCQMACKFCATGTMGFRGDLTVAEILEQVLEARGVRDEDESLGEKRENAKETTTTTTKNKEKGSSSSSLNVVFMGMGEPLNNYDAVVSACRALLDETLFALGKVTVSTVGITAKMARLATDEPRANLALSLHAATQEKRASIMPAAKAEHLSKVVEALDQYVERRGHYFLQKKKKRSGPLVMLEYILLGGVNDGDDDAKTLGALVLKSAFGRKAMVNLIAYNPVPGLDFQRPSEDTVRRFQRIVQQASGVLTCVRLTVGDDVDGACGQLAKLVVVDNRRDDASDLRDIEDSVVPLVGREKKKNLGDEEGQKKKAKKIQHHHHHLRSGGLLLLEEKEEAQRRRQPGGAVGVGADEAAASRRWLWSALVEISFFAILFLALFDGHHWI